MHSGRNALGLGLGLGALHCEHKLIPVAPGIHAVARDNVTAAKLELLHLRVLLGLTSPKSSQFVRDYHVGVTSFHSLKDSLIAGSVGRFTRDPVIRLAPHDSEAFTPAEVLALTELIVE